MNVCFINKALEDWFAYEVVFKYYLSFVIFLVVDSTPNVKEWIVWEFIYVQGIHGIGL